MEQSRTAQALAGLQVAFGAVYIWEYLTNLDHDFKLVRQPWPWSLTTSAYMLCRTLSLVSAVSSLVVSFTQSCAPMYPLYISSTLAVLVASGLLAIRVTAIWTYKTTVVCVAAIGLLAQLGLWIYNVSQEHMVVVSVPAPDNSESSVCILGDAMARVLAPILCTFAFDLSLFILMFLGLKRQHSVVGESRLLSKLRNQGFIWIAIGLVGNVPAVVSLLLNLNKHLSLLFVSFAGFLLAISATRMTRTLYYSNTQMLPISSGGRPLTTVEVHPSFMTSSDHDVDRRSDK